MHEISKSWVSVIVITLVGLYSLPASASGENEELNKIKVMWDQRVPMRDGAELSADIFLPRDEGRYPTLLMRNPYTKSTRRAGIPHDFISHFAERGYAMVGQDVRGRGDSDGEFGYYHADVEDGYDSVEWAASQPWSNGKVCMIGVSYLGTVQWEAAKVRPPHLVCLVSTAAAGDFMDEIGYVGGVFSAMGALDWVNSVSGRTWQDGALYDLIGKGLFDWEEVLWHRPLNTMDEVFGRKMKIYQDYLKHPTMDDHRSVEACEDVLVYSSKVLDEPLDVMVDKMEEFSDWPVFKIKLGTDKDIDIIRALRERTDAVFRVDANCAWGVEETIRNSIVMKDLGVEFIEQPMPAENWEGMKEVFRESALPLIADESCVVEADVERCAGYFHGVNIKLTKCGGMTPALRMIKKARELGLELMVGCMGESTIGTSAIAHLAPLLDYVDMDGTLLLSEDLASGLTFDRGRTVYTNKAGLGFVTTF